MPGRRSVEDRRLHAPHLVQHRARCPVPPPDALPGRGARELLEDLRLVGGERRRLGARERADDGVLGRAAHDARLDRHEATALEAPQRIEQVQRQLGCVCHRVTVLVHVDILTLAGIRLGADAIEASSNDDRLEQIGVGGTIG